MKRNVIFLYLLPTVFIGMILVYWRESLLTWTMFLLSIIFPVVITCLYVKNNGTIKGVLIGTVMFFSTNIILIQSLNKMNLAKATGLMWHGYFKPFYTEHLFLLIFVLVVLVELICYSIIKTNRV